MLENFAAENLNYAYLYEFPYFEKNLRLFQFPMPCSRLALVVWDISRWEMGKGKNVGGKFPAGKRHWENGKNIPPKYRQFWDLN